MAGHVGRWRVSKVLRSPWSLLVVGVGLAVPPAQAAETTIRGVSGRLYADLGTHAVVPSGPMTRHFDQTMLGFSFEFGVGLRGIPLTLGLGVYEDLMGSDSWATGESGLWIYDGNVVLGDLYLGRHLDVRGIDLVVRLEPETWRFRPFLELRGGIAQIHCTWTLQATVPELLLVDQVVEQEKTGNITARWGYGAGLRIEAYRLPPAREGTLALIVSLGIRRSHAGSLRYLEPAGSRVGPTTTYAFAIAQPPFVAWEPFLLLGFESRSW